METFINFLNFLGYITTVIVIAQVVLAIVAWVKGIFPALLNLGNGLSKRKIAIFAKSDTLSSLNSLLLDSGLFKESNITKITKVDDFGKSEQSTLYLVYWPDWKDHMIEIRNLKKDNEALVIYAPSSGGMIPEDIMSELDKKRNITVVNFRGRLLNDLITAMITSGYIKK